MVTILPVVEVDTESMESGSDIQQQSQHVEQMTVQNLIELQMQLLLLIGQQ